MADQDLQSSGRKLGPATTIRAVIGGWLMGMANLVPGISGGTMLVAAGIYREFIDAIADITRFRFNRRAVTLLVVVVVSALVSIAGLAGVVSLALAEFRWGAYSLFIGLTLGGAPLLAKMASPMTRAAWCGFVAGLMVMIGLVAAQTLGTGNSGGSSGPLMLAIGGAAGAGAMILPGVSGAYLLLLLGQYRPIVDAIKETVSAARVGDFAGVIDQLGVLVPVGVGVVLGVVVIANLLRAVMHRWEKATLGVLLGLLIGAPAGLYPFKQGVPPSVGEVFEGAVVTQANVAELADPENARDWPERVFTPTAGEVFGSLGLIVLGAGLTFALARVGGRPSDRKDD